MFVSILFSFICKQKEIHRALIDLDDVDPLSFSLHLVTSYVQLIFYSPSGSAFGDLNGEWVEKLPVC